MEAPVSWRSWLTVAPRLPSTMPTEACAVSRRTRCALLGDSSAGRQVGRQGWWVLAGARQAASIPPAAPRQQSAAQSAGASAAAEAEARGGGGAAAHPRSAR